MNTMTPSAGRPGKAKITRQKPLITRISPRGKPGKPDEVTLSLRGYEAIRLADHLDLSQKKAAGIMGISQQTFSRTVRKARHTIADAIVNAKILRIQKR